MVKFFKTIKLGKDVYMKTWELSKRSMVLAFVLVMIFTSFSLVAADTFSDIDNHWAKEYIDYLADKDLVDWISDDTYRPNDNVSRVEFLTMINQALVLSEELETSEIEFTDIDEDAWYYEEVAKAINKGYVTGHSDGTFAPDNPVTREQAATMIAKAFELEGSSKKMNFLDKNSISSWARDFVNVVSEKGYIVGYPDGNFKADLHITRGQAASIIYRLLTGDVAEVPEPPAPVKTAEAKPTKADEVIKEAKKYLGYRYVSGGASPRGFDCSGFTSYVYGKVGKSLPRTTTGQASVGTKVSKSNLKRGDLLVFSNTYRSGVSHVGIYLGNGQFIHSANPRVGVEINQINSGYWSSHFSYGRSLF